MLSRKILLPNPGSVVGTIHSNRCLDIAGNLPRNAVDLFEIRLDAFAAGALPRLLRIAKPLSKPLIITVRHPSEGGRVKLSAIRRRELFAQFLPYAAWIDLELRSIAPLRPVIEQARANGVGLIVSHHDFKKAPSRAVLFAKRRAAQRAGAQIFKVAAMISDARDLALLFSFLLKRGRMPLSVMGMGPLGKMSRLLFATTGSVLNYGYLGGAQVPGQWPAVLLKERILELR
jgi:3-dehydroquinate dehydratase I